MLKPMLGVLAGLLLGTQAGGLPGQAQKVPKVDDRTLISRADLILSQPASRSEEGLPLGNGVMGTLVWTEPGSLKFQINRVDVFGQNRATKSFPQRDSDYAAGCAYLDIDFADFGDDPFAGGDFRQHLSLYDALMNVQGRGVQTRLLAWPDRDVIAVEVEDRRSSPEPIRAELRMLRYAIQSHPGENYRLVQEHAVKYQTRNHTALSRLDIRDGRIALIQEFREGDYYNASAVAVAVIGRDAKAEYANDAMVRLTAAPGPGTFTILIASASSFDDSEDPAANALIALDEAAAAGFAGLRESTEDWWHEFWRQGRVHLHSPDGQADLIEANYHYFLYLMAASSRGRYPPRFAGMLWRTTGDLSRWGSQYWWANTYAYYGNLMPSNRMALMDPVFSMYSGLYDSAALAARQQWGSEGIWIPEIVWFDGLEELPEEIAAEMRELYLMRKPWEERSEQFRRYADSGHPHNSRWNWKAAGRWVDGQWVYSDKGTGPFGHTTHMMSVAGRIALIYWDRYLFTMDREWLRGRAYPMLKGAVEFYRNFPNMSKGADGLYHIRHVNSGEGTWDAQDTPYELYVLHRLLPVTIRASEILDEDAGLRGLWQEFHTHLVPEPDPAREDAPGLPTFRWFAVGGGGPVGPQTTDAELKEMLVGGVRLDGREENYIDSGGSGWAGIMRNRLRLREGPGAIDAEHLGATAWRVHEAVLQSHPESPGQDPVLKIFPWWPRDWDAEFTLLARGGFLVSAAISGGRIEAVKIDSQVGGECRLRNPWGNQAVSVSRNGEAEERLEGESLIFSTEPHQRITLIPAQVQ